MVGVVQWPTFTSSGVSAVLERLGFADEYRAITPPRIATHPAQPYSDGYYDRWAAEAAEGMGRPLDPTSLGQLIERHVFSDPSKRTC